MEKTKGKVISIQEFKDKKKNLEIDRKELIALIRQIAKSK